MEKLCKTANKLSEGHDQKSQWKMSVPKINNISELTV